MPYINPQRRRKLNSMVMLDTSDLQYIGRRLRDPGELNYAITQLVLGYVEGIFPDSRGYSRFNTVMGVFSSAQAEFYRRVVAPYEDQKILENGDVY